MLLFYAADMHGSERVWRKFLNAAQFYGAEVLVLGGDITGKILVPVLEERLGHYAASVFGKIERVKRPADLEPGETAALQRLLSVQMLSRGAGEARR